MPSRAKTLDELVEKMSRITTPEGRASGLAFTPRASDLFVAPYSKCGTTWTQQIVHSLRTGGDLDFDDICRVIPYLEVATDLGLDLEAAQPGDRRVFKSHLSWGEIPKGARYIVVTRDPRDAMFSSYKFIEGWFFDPGDISVDELGRYLYLDGGGYYRHLTSWWERRQSPDVLLLAYEHMYADLDTAVRRIADFMGVTDEALIAIACHQASFDTMRANQPRYDDLIYRAMTDRRCDIPVGGDSSKVRVGGSRRTNLSPELLADLDAKWRETVGAATGLASYEDLLAELAG